MIHIPSFNENVHNKDHFCPNFILRPDLYAKMVPNLFLSKFQAQGVLIPSDLVPRPESYWQEFTVPHHFMFFKANYCLNLGNLMNRRICIDVFLDVKFLFL